MIYNKMNVFTKEDVKLMKGLDRPGPMLFQAPESMTFFVNRAFKHTVCEQPIRWGLQVVTLIAAIVWGAFTHHWTPFFIFVTLTIALRGWLLFNYARLYRVLRKGPCHYRTDKYGISLIIERDNGEFVRYVTDSWSLVRSVYAYRDFIAIKMDKASEGANEYLLFAEDVDKARNSILGFWQHSIHGIAPEEQPDFYTEEEVDEATDFIADNFGEIECIGHENISPDIHIDLAVIKPTAKRPYYTICTIGAGAFRMNVPTEERLENFPPEYNEYVIYLPADWNVMDEGFEKEENWWPLRLLKSCARGCMEIDGYFTANDLFIYNEPLDASTSACAAYFDYPLPDIDNPTKMHLSTGRTVSFLQVMPLDREEVDYYERKTDYDDRYQHFFDIDLEAIEESSPEERIRTFEEKILEHFNSMIIKRKS